MSAATVDNEWIGRLCRAELVGHQSLAAGRDAGPTLHVLRHERMKADREFAFWIRAIVDASMDGVMDNITDALLGHARRERGSQP